MIALIDYGAGNLTSVRKALAALGAEVLTPAAPADVAVAEGIIVPGVGHFEATRALDRAWREAIRGALDRGVALFGICLGMQWLYEGSEEAPGLAGLGVFEGTCHRLTGESTQDLQVESPVVPGGTQKPGIGPTPFSTLLKVPHVGWNQLGMRRVSALLRGIEEQAQVYFTHSYVAPVTSVTAAVTSYGTPFAAAVEDGRIAGVQFHPEKSGDVGLRILRNWLEIANRRRATAQGRPSTILQREFTGGPRTDRLSKRIIACLDVRDGRVVKGINFEGLREAGDPGELAARYNRDGIDEIVILDVTATIEARQARAHTINAVAREIFLPLAVGGGIRSEDDAAAAIDAGADKVSLNTAALSEPGLITRLAARYGSQAVIVAIDAKRGRGRFEVYARSGTDQTSRDAVEWACEAADRGAGEILLTSIDRDGTKAGFDCELTAAVSRAVSIPVIASGGAGTFEHFAEVFTAGAADAALAASIFHFNERSVSTLKSFLAERHIPVRGSAIDHSSELSG